MNQSGQLNIEDVVRKSIKLVLEGLVIAVCTKLIPGNKVSIQHILMITLVAALIFGLLDTFSPATSTSVRWGAGIGLGYALVGLTPAMGAPQKIEN